MRFGEWLCGSIVLAISSLSGQAAAQPSQPALEDLGKRVFFDEISNPTGMSCATCHVPETGWTSGSEGINLGPVVVPGVAGTSGGRKPPAAAYASFSPPFSAGTFCVLEIVSATCVGGVFWDGRATGAAIGNEVFRGDPALQDAYAEFLGPVADQALGPFANPVEMNMPLGDDNGLPGAESVCRHVAAAPYATLYEAAWGEPLDCETSGKTSCTSTTQRPSSRMHKAAPPGQPPRRRARAIVGPPRSSRPLAWPAPLACLEISA